MPQTFAITTTATNVPLDSRRHGQVAFTVSNTSGRALQARARVVAMSPVAAPWLTVGGEAERAIPVAGSQEFGVQVAVPPDAPPGSYAFRLDAIGLDDPDDEYSQGPGVTFTVPAPVPARKPFPWWIPVAAAVVLLAAVGGGIFLVAQANACLKLPAGLVHAYSGEGDAADRVGSALGTASGGVTFVPGEVRQAFSFNGVNGALDLGPTVGNLGGNDFTIELWIRTAAPRTMGILGNRNDGCGFGGQWLDLRTLSTGAVLYEVLSNQAITPLTSASRVFGDGKFHHLAAIRQGPRIGLYVDGQVDQVVSTGSVYAINNSTPLIAGRSACTGVDGTGFLAGQLDEIGIYNRALTAAEIAGIFRAGSTPRCPAPGR